MPSKPAIVRDGYHDGMLCRNCGFCCTLSPKLTDSDVENIKKLGFLEPFFVKKNIVDEQYMKHEDGKCIFLSIKNTKNSEEIGCEIYEHRPIACRIYPSFDHKLKECPNKGKSWKSCKDDPMLKPIMAFKNL